MRAYFARAAAAAIVVCFACLSGCSRPPAAAPQVDTRVADEAAIRAASAEWARAAAAKDLERTLSFYAEDASMFPPNAPMAAGADARRKTWIGLFAPADLVFTNGATRIEAARSGDLAYETGTFEESFNDADGKPVRVVGKVRRRLEEAVRRPVEGRRRRLQHRRVGGRPTDKAPGARGPCGAPRAGRKLRRGERSAT